MRIQPTGQSFIEKPYATFEKERISCDFIYNKHSLKTSRLFEYRTILRCQSAFHRSPRKAKWLYPLQLSRYPAKKLLPTKRASNHTPNTTNRTCECAVVRCLTRTANQVSAKKAVITSWIVAVTCYILGMGKSFCAGTSEYVELTFL